MMLACARLDAPHTVVFGGLSVEALASRIADCGARFVVTADGGYRRGAACRGRHAVLLDDFLSAALVRCVRGALVHHRGGLVRQRPVDDVGVPDDPADVGGAPVHVGVCLEVQDAQCVYDAPTR